MSKAVTESVKQVEKLNSNLTFGEILAHLKLGAKVSRIGWNGKGMWLALVAANNYIIPNKPTGDGEYTSTERVGLLPWIGMKTADNMFVPWLASQTDVLAEDWMVLSD